MDKAINNKKTVPGKGDHVREKPIVKAGFSRSEQDAQKDYVKSMKMHGDTSQVTTYAAPNFGELKPERGARGESMPDNKEAGMRKDSGSTSIGNKKHADPYNGTSGKSMGTVPSDETHSRRVSGNNDLSAASEGSGNEMPSSTISQIRNADTGPDIQKGNVNPVNVDETGHTGFYGKADVISSKYEKSDSGYSYHGNLQQAQSGYILRMKSHSQETIPERKDISGKGTGTDASANMLHKTASEGGDVRTVRKDSGNKELSYQISQERNKNAGADIRKTGDPVTDREPGNTGVTTKYEKTDKGYVYHGNMQQAQEEYVVFMKSRGQGSTAERQDFRQQSAAASAAYGAEVKKIEIDRAPGIIKNPDKNNPYTIHGPSAHRDSTETGDEIRAPEKSETIATDNNVMRLTSQDISEIKDFDLSKMRTSGTGLHKIAKLERLAIKASTLYLISTVTYGSDVHRGAETARDIYGTAALIIADNARITMAKSLEKNASRNLALYDKLLKETGGEHMFLKYSIRGQIADQKDVQKLQWGINAILQKQYGVTIKGTGKVGWWNASRFLKMNEAKLSPEIKILIKTAFKDAMNIQTFTGNGRVGRLRALTRMGSRRIARYIRQSEAGYGAYLTYNILTRGRSLLRGALFTVRSTARVGYKALVMGAKGLAWGAGKAAKHIPKPVKEAVKNNTFVRKASNAKNKAADVGKKARRKGQNAVDRFRKFRRDPFGLKARISGAGKRAANAALNRLNQTWLKKPIKVGGKVLKAGGKVLRVPNIISSAIGRVMAAIASIVSTVVSFTLVGIIAVVAILLLLSFLLNLFTSIISLFDFTAHEEEIVNAALEQIESCYEEQIDSINAMRGNYRNMTITYRDVRDDEAYEEHEVTVAETTNSAEILSMATVYFDFDLEDAGERKVKDYVRKLYNGSHQTTIATRTYNYTDENGDPYTVTDADVTLTTYYFNGLFDCELADDYGTLSGTTTTMQVWNYFRSAGFSEEATAGIMGNLYQESGVDPTAIQGNGAGPAAGIAQWENYNTQSGRWKEMADYCESQGKPWTDLKCQLDYILIEMPGIFSVYTGNGTYTYPNGTVTWWPDRVTMDQYKQLDDIDTAVEIFERTFERASIPNMARRISQAHAYYDMYHGVEASSAEAQLVIDRAYSQLGKPYVYGAVGPDSYDCSGLVGYALTGRYERIGTTYTYMEWPRVSNPQPGDICTSESHCGIYIGNNQMIHAPHTGDVVKIGPVPDNMIFVRYPG